MSARTSPKRTANDSQEPHSSSQAPTEDEQIRKKELREKAAILLKQIHYEVSMRPHIENLSKQVNKLQKEYEATEAKTKELQQNIDNDKHFLSSSEITEDYKSEREEKVRLIQNLEQELSQLLAQKASLLSQAEYSLQES